MPHRDPETGQFVADAQSEFTDIEVATFNVNGGVEAANLSGTTGVRGDEFAFSEGVVDYDEFVDRNEELHLLQATHYLVSWVNSTETADGTLVAKVALKADPAQDNNLTKVGINPGATLEGDVFGIDSVDDSIDYVGRPLYAASFAPFSDGATGVGGAGSAGEDRYDSTDFPSEFGRFHPRDDLFAVGELRAYNIADAAIHFEVGGQHVYGVLPE